MKLAIRTAAWLAAATLAGAAPAQPGAPAPTPLAVRTLHRFARCVALESPARARAVLAIDPNSPAFANALQRLLDHGSACLDHGSLGGNERFFAGRMAEALLLRDLRGGDLAHRVAYDAGRPPVRAADEGELMSICVVRAVPAEVAALFATEPASSAEAAAMRALVPHLGRCLRDGVQGQFNRPAIRSMLALAALRLSDNNEAR